ncbi:retrotransposon protein, putative, ty1-copia subclass [Tanacetum coccineum]
MRNLRFTIRYENKEYVLDEQIPTIDDDSTQKEIEAHQKHYDDANKVSCIMESSMSPELQKTFESTRAYEMNQQLKEMFQAKASKERLDVMKGYFDRLESPNMVFDAELSINIILSGLPTDYNQFMLSYQMKGKETSIMELHSLLRTVEQGIKKIDVLMTSATPVLTGLKESKRLKHGELNLVMGNRKIMHVTRIGNHNDNVILNVGSSNELDKLKLQHSRLGYGYVYLIKHKSDTFEVFKRYQNEVENQLDRKIKVLRSDRGGEYLSIEFFDHLKNYGIVSQLTPPRTPQLNGVLGEGN